MNVPESHIREILRRNAARYNNEWWPTRSIRDAFNLGRGQVMESDVRFDATSEDVLRTLAKLEDEGAITSKHITLFGVGSRVWSLAELADMNDLRKKVMCND